MRKKYLAFLLAGCMSLSFSTAAWGAEEPEDPAQTETSLDTAGETEGRCRAWYRYLWISDRICRKSYPAANDL